MTVHAAVSAVFLRPCASMPDQVENKNSRLLNTANSNRLPARCRDQTWQSPFRVNLVSVALVCLFRHAEICPHPQARLPANGQTRKPKDWLAPRHPARQDSTPLHSAQLAAPFRQPSFVTPGIDWCDRRGVEFSAKCAPNPSLLPSQMAGAAIMPSLQVTFSPSALLWLWKL